MELKKLKEKLNNKDKIALPLIFIADNNNFLVNEYLYAVAKNNGLNAQKIADIQELKDIESGTFFDNDILFILEYNKDVVIKDEELNNSNLIILTDKKIENTEIEQINFPKLENWMIEEYAHTKLEGLNNDEVSWLCKEANYDINRVNNECKKISLFDKEKQEDIFNLINEENGYSDLNSSNVFTLTDAIVKKDIVALKNIVKSLDNLNIDFNVFLNVLIKNFKNIIDIQTCPKNTPERLSMSEKQFKAICYRCGKYSNEQLYNIYDFLTSIDYRIKKGDLNLSNNDLIVYLISNILNI